MQSELTLYAYVKQFVEPVQKSINDLEIADAERLIHLIFQKRDEKIDKALQKARYVLNIYGAIRITGIDPMNITARGKKVLHENFVRLKMGEQEFLLQKPVIALNDENIFHSEHVQILLDEKPIVEDGQLTIADIGVVKGRIDESKLTLWLE